MMVLRVLLLFVSFKLDFERLTRVPEKDSSSDKFLKLIRSVEFKSRLGELPPFGRKGLTVLKRFIEGCFIKVKSSGGVSGLRF
mmetsp:Transcript_9534/g.18522  ORF Transcript_9534/g.18522 Transcript_9534/m.18522 type:complete len:83 (-) Transcript_9534:3570-3818(-)